MITEYEDRIDITLTAEAVEQTIAWLEDLKDFCLKDRNSHAHAGYVQTAIETMKAFWCEHFGKEEQ